MYSLPDPLLDLLLASPQISGEACGQRLGISRAAVHKRVEKLRTRGWNISAAPKRGLLLGAPYPCALIPELIAPHISLPLFFTEEIGSTNAYAKTLAAKAPFVLMTRKQSQGSGRAGRGWHMQPDRDLAFSYVCQSSLPLSHLFSVIRISALSVHGALSALGVDCLIKWPNDVITPDGRKLCGILSETIAVENTAQTLIIGIGVNGNGRGLPAYAQSASEFLGRDVDINLLAADIIGRLELFLGDFPANEGEVIRAWEKELAWVGGQVHFEQNGEKHEGIFMGCGQDGAVILEKDGLRKTFYAGDLSQVKLRKS